MQKPNKDDAINTNTILLGIGSLSKGRRVREVISEGKSNQCKIKLDVLETHFKQIFENENNLTCEEYHSKERHENVFLTVDNILLQMKRISLDTSADPDRVIMKTLLSHSVLKSIPSIANVMLHIAYIPTSFLHDRMVLIDKGGDVNRTDNWRPITNYSVFRGLIKKTLDAILKNQIGINCNQRVSCIPGCYINSRLINACLSNAKLLKTNCTITFLGV